MRTLAVVAMTGLLALVVAGAASAAPSVSFVWSGTTGAGTTGSSSITAVAGDTLTLDLLITPDGQGVSFAGLSYDISAAGTVTNFYRSGLDSINDGTGFVYDANSGNAVYGSATYTGGTLTFVPGSGVTCPGPPATGNLAAGFCGNTFMGALATGTDQGGGIIGSFATATAGAPATVPFTLAQASFVVVPEPATGGLLALGLGALAFMGRRRA
jgi:PEP-CTERM motif